MANVNYQPSKHCSALKWPCSAFVFMKNKLKLLQLLDSTDPTQLKLELLELCGLLLTMMHWQRGIIDMLVVTKAVQLEGEWLENWRRVIQDLETYEQFAWEIAPARAMLPVMRHHRLTNELPEEAVHATAKDGFGRIPYNTPNLDYIENLLRRILDCRIYEAENGTECTESQEHTSS